MNEIWYEWNKGFGGQKAMKQTVQRTAVLLAVIGAVGLAAASVRSVKAQRKPAPAQRQIPAPLTKAQVRSIFPGTTGSVVARPDKFTLYTIQSMQMELAPPKSKTYYLSSSMNGYKITGKAEITDRDEQARLIASAFYTGHGFARQAGCFMPHHALRLVKNKRTVDVIICFGCGNTQIWESGEQKTRDVAANLSAYDYVASVLAKHHVPQAK